MAVRHANPNEPPLWARKRLEPVGLDDSDTIKKLHQKRYINAINRIGPRALTFIILIKCYVLRFSYKDEGIKAHSNLCNFQLKWW